MSTTPLPYFLFPQVTSSPVVFFYLTGTKYTWSWGTIIQFIYAWLFAFIKSSTLWEFLRHCMESFSVMLPDMDIKRHTVQTVCTQSESHNTMIMNENLALQVIYIQINSYRVVMILVMRSVWCSRSEVLVSCDSSSCQSFTDWMGTGPNMSLQSMWDLWLTWTLVFVIFPPIQTQISCNIFAIYTRLLETSHFY